MTKIVTVAAWAAPCALLGLVLAGCGGSSSHSTAAGSAASTPAGSAASSSPATGFASTSAGTPAGHLSKADFVIRTNALCSAVDAQRKALPTPASATDFAAISTNLTGSMRLLPSLISHAQTLVAQSADQANLEKNWLSVERADYAMAQPIVERMVADSNAHDAAKVQADGDALDAMPDHSSSLIAFLTGYGLSSCASLESR